MAQDNTCEQDLIVANIDTIVGILERFRTTLLNSDNLEEFIVCFKNSSHLSLDEIPTGIIQWFLTGRPACLRSAECLLFLINSVKKTPVNLLSKFVRTKMFDLLESPSLVLLKSLTSELHEDLIELIDTLQHLDKLLENE